MKHASWHLVLVVALASSACADERLEARAPKLEITAVTDGYHYAEYDDEALLIDLGEVPVFATKIAAFRLSNPTALPLNVKGVTYSTVNGERWKDPISIPKPLEDRFTGTEVLDFNIPAYGEAQLHIPFAPLEELPGAEKHLVVVDIQSDAATGSLVQLTVRGKAIFTGEPDIEVEYNAYRGPDVAADCTNGNCVIPDTQGLDFGNIGLGAQGTARLILRNAADCTPFIGVDACSLCSLTVDADPDRDNIGLDFEPGSNDAGLFAFAGSTATPFEIRQRNPEPQCGEAGEVRLLLTFNAPMEEGEHRTTIIVESNDPQEPNIRIPVIAHARNAPIAIAKFREYDATNPSAPYTDPNDVEPLTTVYFDGRDSYDPADPTNPAAITAWQWDVIEYPNDANPLDFNLSGQTSGLFSFWLPTIGHYVVQLTVWNASGIQSGDTTESKVEFDVIPGSALHVQLSWDNASNDQDLHMTHMVQDDRVCNQPWDCHWLNKTPVWDAAFADSTGPNPTLDIDDTNGLGPENISIDVPQAGVYRVYVHYYGDFNFSGVSPTRETIKISLNGLQVAEYRRTLTTEKAVWAVADITWNADGSASVAPYPSDSPGEVGAVNVMQDCSTPGWAFP